MRLQYYTATEITICVGEYLEEFVGNGILSMDQVLTSIKPLSHSYGLGSGLILSVKQALGMSGYIEVRTRYTHSDDIADIVDQIVCLLDWETVQRKHNMKLAKQEGV